MPLKTKYQAVLGLKYQALVFWELFSTQVQQESFLYSVVFQKRKSYERSVATFWRV